MRVAEFKQIHTHTEQRVVHHDAEFDDTGNMTADAWDELWKLKFPSWEWSTGMLPRKRSTTWSASR